MLELEPKYLDARKGNLSTGSTALVRRRLTGVIIVRRCTLLNNGEVIMRTSHLLLRN